ncbi:hypothetical protein CLAIMM_07659 [Cladophialophora immunda]|nr:hypothetical protein CLAIMM_07659 [Cladophialophora immunda]
MLAFTSALTTNDYSPLYVCLAIIVAVLFHSLFTYLRDPLHLRRFPAPSTAGFSLLWSIYHSLGRKRFVAVHEAHKRLGPIVRLGPRHLSFSDPQAYKKIYGHSAPVIKDELYANLGLGNPSMFQIVDKEPHGQRRKLLSHVFAAKQINQMEPRVTELVMQLCRAFEIKSTGGQIATTDEYPAVQGAFDVRPWMNMFAYDVITSVFWSKPYGFLKTGNDRCMALTASGEARKVRAIETQHRSGNFAFPLVQLSKRWWELALRIFSQAPGCRSMKNFRSMARYIVRERIDKPPTEPDLFSSFPLEPTEKRKSTLSADEILAECSTMLLAGQGTTQISLTNCIYHLAKNPDKQDKLRKCLYAAIPPESRPVASYTDLQNLPMLRACLDESFRCNPPVTFGLPRLVTNPGMTICGHYIAPGVVVSSPLHEIHHDERLFKDPWKFIPERWLEGSDADYIPSAAESANLTTYVQPFGMGGRGCIGRNIAYLDLSVAIAALVMAFDWELSDPNKPIEYNETVVTTPIELWVKARLREGMEIDAQLKRKQESTMSRQPVE